MRIRFTGKACRMGGWRNDLCSQTLTEWLNEPHGKETLTDHLKVMTVKVGADRAAAESRPHPTVDIARLPRYGATSHTRQQPIGERIPCQSRSLRL